jgi:hypothetical protein
LAQIIPLVLILTTLFTTDKVLVMYFIGLLADVLVVGFGGFLFLCIRLIWE